MCCACTVFAEAYYLSIWFTTYICGETSGTECNFNLHDYWADLAKKRERSRFIKVMLFCGISGLLIIFAGTMFLTGKDVLYPLGIGGGLVAMAYAASLRIDKI
jgi:hypothetical protein